ncbi:MAG: preprotein translocase subunit SecY [Candidatus Pacebacteria bacterium]|nr:preprotein translocase subunit SecY [Candidatus Paceibacterota bacterium]
MNSFVSKLKIFFLDPSVRNKTLVVLGLLILFRLLTSIPIPGVDTAALSSFLSNNQLFGFLNVFSGGGLSQLSIAMLGVGPYITASIIMQLSTIMIPGLKTLYHDEGEAGRKKFNQYSRLLTVPLAAFQGYFLLSFLQKQGVLMDISFADQIFNVVVITATAMFLMWIGELITEFGIGNGVSILIFAGIVAALPREVGQLLFAYDPSQLLTYIGFGIIALVIIYGIVLVTEAERPIPITYARQVRSGGQVTGGVSTYLPLRISQAGVMPIIFAMSILLFPQMVGSFMAASSTASLQSLGSSIIRIFENSWVYGITYFLLVFLFTYFYTAITFEPESVASNLQKNGAFVPGVRPGEATTKYISTVMNRITLVGGLFLGLVAVLPIVLQSVTGVASFAIGGTALLIVVSVVIDLFKKYDAQLSMREY